MSAPEAVTPVTLWLCECDGPGFESWRVESSDDVDVTLDRKFTALPAAQYAALVAEVSDLRWLLDQAKGFVLLDSAEDTPFGAMRRDMIARIDTALGAERG